MAAITGLNELLAAFTALPEAVRVNVLADVCVAGAQVIQAGASSRAPRLTGQLASDIRIDVELLSEGFVAKIGPSKRSFYGLFQERGTVHQPAYPFLKPALDEDGPRAHQAMVQRLALGIEAEATRLRTGVKAPA
jgi:HK97 gp10 family phage protein